MKYIVLFFSCWLITTTSQAQDDSTKVKPAKLTKEVSYSYGYNFASDLNGNENFEKEERETKYVIKGLKDGMKPDSVKLAEIVDGLVVRIEDPTNATKGEDAQQTAYNLGYNALGNLISVLELDKKDLRYACIKAGYLDFVKEKTPKVAPDRQRELLAKFLKEKQQRAEDRYRERRQKAAKENLVKAEAFLKENAKKTTVKSTASGLQYQVLKEGTGAQPSVNGRVSVHYTGSLIDGKVFDSSIERGEPTEFALKDVIKGWQEGIALMREGGRYRFFIPPALAYGEEGREEILPNTLLIFEVELLQVIEEEGPESRVKQLSYAYGYTVGKALIDLNLTKEETDVVQFVKGFERGFRNNPTEVAEIEEYIKERMNSKVPSTTAKQAATVALGIGYASSSSLVKAVNAYPVDFDPTSLAEGYQTGLDQQTPFYSEVEMSRSIENYAKIKQSSKKQPATPPAQNSEELAANLKAGQDFLTQNITKEGITELPSGLQYQVIKEGTGEQPTASSTVTTHYRGSLIDGTIFDSSYERNQPATFPLNRVIKGWQEGIPLMKEGATYRLFIPAHLAYGNSEQGDKIPAGATLIFEVELLKIE